MTIVLNLYFEPEIEQDALVNILLNLSEDIKPKYYHTSDHPVVRKNKIQEIEKFVKFRNDNKEGFYLHTEGGDCIDISTYPNLNAKVTVFFESPEAHKLSESYLKACMSKAIVFGFCCNYEEYENRNRLEFSYSGGRTELWIGREIDKKMPGLYWQILVSQTYLDQNNIDLESLRSTSLVDQSFPIENIYWFKFFDNPNLWAQHADKLNSFCEVQPGIFSRREIDNALKGVIKKSDFNNIIEKIDL